MEVQEITLTEDKTLTDDQRAEIDEKVGIFTTVLGSLATDLFEDLDMAPFVTFVDLTMSDD